MKGGVKE